MAQRLRHIVIRLNQVESSDALPYVALEHLESGTGRLIDQEPSERLPKPAGMVQVRTGDVLFGKLRPYLAKTWLADRSTLASSELVALRPRPGIEPRWLHYVVQSRAFVDWAIATSDGAKMPRTSWDDLGEFRVDVPPLPQQRAIADYLDAETARIHQLITEYERSIERQLEKRASVTAAGVAGMWLAAARRPTRLPWLQALPIHWEEVKLSLLARLGSGHTPSREHPEWWIDATIPWITTGEVRQMRDDRIEYIYETREMISHLGLVNSAAELHPAGTVVLSRTASAGFSAIMGRDMATSQDFVTWTCGPRLRARYLLLCLRAMRHDLLGRLAMGSTHKTIYVPDIQSIRIPLPPLAEQDDIVEAVWTRLRAIDSVADASRRQIELLAERRQAVVTAVVTGQVEPAGIAA